MISGFLLASLGPQWHLTYFQSSLILLGGGIASIGGALLFGALADRLGRKPILIAATATCTISAGAIALVPDGNWWVLSILASSSARASAVLEPCSRVYWLN